PRDAAAAADLGRGRRRLLRGGGRRAGGGEPDVRARRSGCADLERVLVAAQARARSAAPVRPHSLRDHARAGAGARAPARLARDARPADDAPARRQRRARPFGRRHVRTAARAARRAVAPRRLNCHRSAMGFTERAARSCSRHPWRTLGAWIALVVLALGATVTLL